jgi:pyridinium-3,5-biscarboxylic acid mononucleotide synthase
MHIVDAKMAVVGEARLDIERMKRKGFPEVVLAQGKQTDDIIRILKRLSKEKTPALATRVSAGQAEILSAAFPAEGLWCPEARVFYANKTATPRYAYPTSIGILTAGLSDRPVAEEAAQILSAANYPLVKICDVGVAGLHRLLSEIRRVENCDAVIVVAGMDGALPSVAAGLLEQPVIAVPTSVGYGVSENGAAALHTMLSSCSPGLAVVNIDNGYGAAMMAHAICMRIHKGVRAAEEKAYA